MMRKSGPTLLVILPQIVEKLKRDSFDKSPTNLTYHLVRVTATYKAHHNRWAQTEYKLQKHVMQSTFFLALNAIIVFSIASLSFNIIVK
jgi:hypothetical protein